MERQFIDEARVHVRAGAGGAGAASFAREAHKPRGKSDGGNGGHGGSVVFRVDVNVATLADLVRNPHQRAERGGNASSNGKNGADGDDRLVLVPAGTVVRDAESGALIADLTAGGEEAVVARGGRGGRGNATLANARRRAPGFAERGEHGQERWLALELKVLADVGLVGFPNAGKSSLIARLSAARPKVADYPFTTLTPNLGVAEAGSTRFVVADVPGLIEGASEGKGLGLAFLRHLERCRVLCFVLDVAAEEPAAALDALRAELRAHDDTFDARESVVVANKIDIATDRVEAARAAAEANGAAFLAVSALRGDGIDELHTLLAETVERARSAAQPKESHRLIKLRPDETQVQVEREGEAWRVRSARAEQLIERFDVTNDDALAFVQNKLLAYGVEDALARAGARAGDEVRIGEVAFDFEPEEAQG